MQASSEVYVLIHAGQNNVHSLARIGREIYAINAETAGIDA
jgi:hypothetical protein